MIDILVTFDDGTTELRQASSPAHPRRHGWGAPITGTEWGADVTPWTLAVCRDESMDVWVERDGQWTAARAETKDEQIERLTRERDEARAAGRVVTRDLLATLRPDAIAAAIVVFPGNNNQPRVCMRGSSVELVRHRRALADMRLPDNVSDANSIRDDAIDALETAMRNPALVASVMSRDLQTMPRGAALDVVPDIADEVDAHRQTKDELRIAQAEIERLGSALDATEVGRDAMTKSVDRRTV